MSELDKEFEETVIKINAKLKEATDALKEVNELREKAGIPSLIFSQWIREDLRYDLSKKGFEDDEFWEKMDEEEAKFDNFNVSPLECELEKAGWSTSSSYC